MYSQNKLRIFYYVELLLLILISIHFFLSTSNIHIISLFKLILFTLSVPLFYLKFAKELHSTILITVTLILFFLITANLPFLMWIYYLYVSYIILTSKFEKIGKIENTYILTGLLIVILSVGTNWIGNFNYLDLLYRGWVHLDSIWLTTISAMYKNYNTNTLGIDGLVPLTYHTFLHKVYAGISVISGLKSIEVFSLFHPIIAPIVFFSVLYYSIYYFTGKINSSTCFNSTLLFFFLYYFFPYRSVNITLDIFLSESMFLGTILLMLGLLLINQYIKLNNNLSLLLYCIISIIIIPSKSNVAVVNLLIIWCFYFLNYKNLKLLFISIILSIITYLIIQSVVVSVSSVSPSTFKFADTILTFESLLPRVGISQPILRVIYFTVVFYSSTFLFYLLYFKNYRIHQWNDIRFIAVSITLAMSVVFNYFYSIGFNTFYFTGPVILFSLIGISSLIEFKPIRFKYQVAIVSFIALYCVADLIRMGHPSNCNNYVYNRISNNHKNYKSKAFIDKLMSVKPGKDIVVHYNVDSLDHGVYGKEAVPFIVSALTESVTIGHVPKYDFYGHGDYRKSYKVILPKNYKIINLNDSTTSGQ